MLSVCAAIMVDALCEKASHHLESKANGVWETKTEERELTSATRSPPRARGTRVRF